MSTDTAVLSIRDVGVTFDTEDGPVPAVRGVSYDVHAGEIVGVVGESGSGKSVTVLAAMGLLASRSANVTGSILLQGKDLRAMSAKQLRAVRGKEISMVFQDPMTSLNPSMKVGYQIVEALQVHDSSMGRRAADERAIELLEIVGVPDAARRAEQYPHEYSGGMRQRAMIAIAVANNPTVLIADEPTTALDVTVQAQVLDALQAAQQATNAGMLLITHDLGLVAEVADRVVVMYGGKVVETGTVAEIFARPKHPYTLGLLTSLPRLDVRQENLIPIGGSPPSPSALPPGCTFNPRCDLRNGREKCVEQAPALPGHDGHRAACHFSEEMPAHIQKVTQELGTPLPQGPS